MAYSYSFNEENYIGSFETREAAIAGAHAENEGYYKEFWTAENRSPDILAAIDGSRFIEGVTESNDDFQIEQAEDWPNCHNGQRDDLTEMLRQTFQAWVLKHNLTPIFWIADNVQKHEFD